MNASRGLSSAHPTPQHGRDLKPIEAVEDAPGFLGIHEGNIEFPGLVRRLGNAVLGDFVEHHALDRDGGLQDFEQVPRDGFAFAVLICCEQNFGGGLGSTLQIGNGFLAAISGDVVGGKVVFEVDTEFSGGTLFHIRRQIPRVSKVAHVTHGGHDLIAIAQVLPNRFRLCWRLDDDELLTRGHASPCAVTLVGDSSTRALYP